MEYFKINYNKLENLQQVDFSKIINVILVIFIFLIIISFYIKVDEKFECLGIYDDNVLKVKVNNKLSDKLKTSQYIIFNNQKTNFKIDNYGTYEIINDEIYQELELIVDEKIYDNEIGKVEFYYDKEILIKYIWNLFK